MLDGLQMGAEVYSGQQLGTQFPGAPSSACNGEGVTGRE